MLIDQDEINQLLQQADDLSEEAAQPAPSPPPSPSPAPRFTEVSPEVRRILKLKVPVIVQLARSRMSVRRARALSLGSIIEFEKPVDDPLTLMIKNRPIGEGVAVRVGENFGLKVSAITDRVKRINSLRQ